MNWRHWFRRKKQATHCDPNERELESGGGEASASAASARKRWWDPLLGFVLAGALLYALDMTLNRSSDAALSATEDAKRITISPLLLQSIKDPQDKEAFVTEFVRREALFREALQRRMHLSDLIVRRRLIQKMEFLYEELAPVDEPTDQQLAEYVKTHREKYERPAQVSFTHVFFNSDRRGSKTKHDASAALEKLAAGQVKPSELGDAFIHQREFQLKSKQQIAKVLGARFARSVMALEPGKWHGPVRSGYGWHLVRVRIHQSAQANSLEQVRRRARRDWLQEQRKLAKEKLIRQLVQKYQVVREPVAQ